MAPGPVGKRMESFYHIYQLKCPILQSMDSGSGPETAQGLCLYWYCCLILLTVLDSFWLYRMSSTLLATFEDTWVLIIISKDLCGSGFHWYHFKFATHFWHWEHLVSKSSATSPDLFSVFCYPYLCQWCKFFIFKFVFFIYEFYSAKSFKFS